MFVPCLSALRIHPLGVDCVRKMVSGSILHVVCVCINRIGTVRPRVIDPAPASLSPVPRASFHALQEWEGYVLEVEDGDLVARLVDLTAGAPLEEEEAIIPRSELSAADDVRIGVGSIFRWVIGYERSPAGTKKRVSQIVLRDLPAITENDLRKGEAWARKMARSLNQ